MDSVSQEAQRQYVAARSAYAVDNLEDALSRVDEALALAPLNAEFLSLRGQILVDLEHPLQGESSLRQALTIDPFQAGARLGLAGLYGKYRRWRDAAAEYTRYLALAPDDPDGWYALGQTRERRHETTLAVDAYSRAIELNPLHQGGLARRATLLLQADDLQGARADLNTLIELQPSADLHVRRGEINLQLDAPLLAAADFATAITLQAAEVPSYTLLIQTGHAYLQGGAPLKAADAYAQAVDLTTSLEPRIWLGEGYLRGGAYAEAVQVLDDLIPLASPLEMGQLLGARGQALLGLGRYEEAVEDLTAQLDFSRGEADRAAILQARSSAYTALGLHEAALADLDAAWVLLPNAFYYYHRGIIRQGAGDNEAAIADLTLFLDAVSLAEVDPDILNDATARLESLTAAEP